MKKILCLSLVLLALPVLAGAETYSWVDDQGTVNFADDLSAVPKKFRKKARRLGGEDEAPVPASAPQGTGPAVEPSMKKDTSSVQQGEKKDALYDGKTESAWRQEILSVRAELKSAQNQLADTKARLNDTSSMSRSEYLNIHETIKSLEAGIKGMRGRHDDLVAAARKAGVPESALK